jgi:hypothetical protein
MNLLLTNLTMFATRALAGVPTGTGFRLDAPR